MLVTADTVSGTRKTAASSLSSHHSPAFWAFLLIAWFTRWMRRSLAAIGADAILGAATATPSSSLTGPSPTSPLSLTILRHRLFSFFNVDRPPHPELLRDILNTGLLDHRPTVQRVSTPESSSMRFLEWPRNPIFRILLDRRLSFLDLKRTTRSAPQSTAILVMSVHPRPCWWQWPKGRTNPALKPSIA